MIESIFLTIFPLIFLIILFGFTKSRAERAPIKKTVFLFAKYSIILLWVGVMLQAWGISISMISLPALTRYLAMFLWVSGFFLLYIGYTNLGESFRIGEPKKKTKLKKTGLYRFSRNPMYVGVYSTILASILFTANLLVLLIGIFIVIVHHMIVLAEERYLRKTFVKEYHLYCKAVRRYI